MRLSVRCFAGSAGVLWGSGLLLVGLVNLAVPTYGTAFLSMLSSVYPGFHGSQTLGDVLLGALYGLLDGGIAGLLFACIYNALAGCCKKT